MRIDVRRLGLGLPLRRLPAPLLIAVAGLVAYGAVYVTSAAGTERTGLATKHLLWASLGLMAFLAVYSLDFRVYVKYAPLAYAVGILALAAVLLTKPVKGAHSWFSLPGGVKMQPSEFMKLAYVLVLSRYLATRPEPLRFRDQLAALAIMLLPVGFILMQPDLGTSMTFMPVVVVAAFVAGARLWQMGVLGAIGAGGAVVMWLRIMRDYQKIRIYAWLNPVEYKLAQAYQLIQSQVAIGSGGLWGKGLGMGTQNQFDLLPLKESDFIFAVIAEEGGFLRASVLLLILVFMVLTGALIALRARDRAGRILAASAVALLGGQALINIGVTLGLLPTTGITLPFVSYGGSSMLTSFMAVGLLANVYARPRERGIFG
jgi:rod shape determining protein RodA